MIPSAERSLSSWLEVLVGVFLSDVVGSDVASHWCTKYGVTFWLQKEKEKNLGKWEIGDFG